MTAAILARGVALLLLAAGAGSLLVVRSAGELTLEETAGWSLGAGALLLACVYALLLSVHASPGPKKLGAILALPAGIAVMRRAPSHRTGAPYSGVALALAAAAAAGLALYAIQACAEPLWSTDFLAIWGLKGKTIYSTGGVPGRLFRDPALAWSHPEYPLLVPFLMAGFSAATGGWNDEALGLVFVLGQIATVLVVAGFCRRRGSPRAGALAAMLVAFWYPLYRAFNTGLAEIPFALSLVLLATAAADGSPARSALAALLCVATKQEGTVFALLVAGTLALRRSASRDRRRSALAIAAVAGLHAAAMILARGTLHDRDFTFAVLAPSHAAELVGRLGRVASALAATWTPAGWLGFACLAGIFLLTRRAREDFLLLPLAAQASIYLGACALSAYDPAWQLRSAFFRIAATLGPALVLAVGCRLAREEAARERALAS
jgi:hypothetical protein